jgi:iron complex outermembrane recepter protein
VIVLTLLLALSSPAADSTAPRDSVFTLPVTRVDRDRVPVDARARLRTGFVSDLPVGVAGRALETLPEVLAEAAGVQVQQYGGLGAFSTVSVRGASPGQVTVMLDGVPLTSAAHGIVSLADLPVTAVERVEVYRGLAPLGLGLATPGGAINLITAANPALRDVRVSRGSFDTWEGRASGGRRVGAFTAFVHAGYQGSSGDFRYDDDNGTPLNPADDSVSTRVNDRFDAATALASVVWTPRERVRVLAREDVFHRAQGLPGIGAIPAWTPRLSLLRSLSLLQLIRDSGPRERWLPRLELGGSLDRERSRFRDTGLPDRGELGVGRHDTDDRLGADALTARLEWTRLLPGVALEGNGSWRGERASPGDAADGLPDPPSSRRDARASGAGLRLEPLGRLLLLHAAERWDHIVDRRGLVGGRRQDVTHAIATPQLGALVRAPFGFEARGNWTRAERLPDFLELFGNLGSVQGNPTLRSERGESWDAGLAWTGRSARGHASVEWSHFESQTRDLIVQLRNSASSVRAMNLSRTRVVGEELSVRGALAAGLSVTGAATWMSALNVGAVPAFWTGKRLPLRPARQLYARVQWRRGPARAGADLQYLGDDMLDPYNRLRAPSRTLAGASLGWELAHDALALTVEGKNLGDRRVSDVGGFPLPGRSVFVSLSARLGAAHPSTSGE